MTERRSIGDDLPSDIWFVRAGRGNKLVPVTSEGRRTVWLFLLGMFGSGLLGGGLVWVTGNIWSLAVMVVGMAGSGFWFIMTAIRHGDRSIHLEHHMSRSRR